MSGRSLNKDDRRDQRQDAQPAAAPPLQQGEHTAPQPKR